MPEEGTGSNRGGPRPVIRASEIGTYVYCRRAWWLKQVAGFDQQGRDRTLAAGTEAHARHGRQVNRSLWQRRLAFRFFLAASLLLALALVLGIVR